MHLENIRATQFLEMVELYTTTYKA